MKRTVFVMMLVMALLISTLGTAFAVDRFDPHPKLPFIERVDPPVFYP